MINLWLRLVIRIVMTAEARLRIRWIR